jgi:DNA-binding MarR family transcriptional regulator
MESLDSWEGILSEGHLILLIIGVILIAGCLGGTINYLLARKTDEDALKIGASIVVGIGAAFLVPLFLYTVSSNLVNDIHPEPGSVDFSKFLVFAGFCLVAAISSRAFIKTLSDRILKEATEAKEKASAAEQRAVSAEEKAIGAEEKANEAKSQIGPLVERATEQDSTEGLITSKESSVPLSETDRKVLETLERGKYILRTRSGLARDSGLDKEAVNQCVEELKTRGLVKSTRIVKQDGQTRTRWYITPEGRAALI